MTRKKPTRGRQQGAQPHAEGEHGAKTREFIRREQITRRLDEDDEQHPRYDPAEIRAHDTLGKDRLFEDRQQHDEAEKGSEITRAARDRQRHRHTKTDDETRATKQAIAKKAK